jgi:hypothetical protein
MRNSLSTLSQSPCVRMTKPHGHAWTAWAWMNVVGMGESHANMRTTCAYGGVNGVNISFFVDFCSGLFFSLSVHQFSPYSDVAFLGFLLIYAIFSKLSSWSSTLSPSPRNCIKKRMSMHEPQERGRTSWAWESRMNIWGSQWSQY